MAGRISRRCRQNQRRFVSTHRSRSSFCERRFISLSALGAMGIWERRIAPTVAPHAVTNRTVTVVPPYARLVPQAKCHMSA